MPVAAVGVVLVIAVAVAIVARSNAMGSGHATGSQLTGTDTPSQTSPASPTAPSKLGPPAGWKLAFNSDFSGSSLDTSVWGTCYPWAPNGCTN